jgi:hypothetical protein
VEVGIWNSEKKGYFENYSASPEYPVPSERDCGEIHLTAVKGYEVSIGV